jgi:death-on-curing protein
MKIITITIEDTEFVTLHLTQKLMTFNEPIPDFGTRYPGKLESCLAMPFGQFDDQDIYQGLVKKAAILFYLMIQNHPFLNGNKRIALTTLLNFLYLNKKWLKTSQEKMYDFVISVAKSKLEEKDLILKQIQNFIKSHLIDLEQHLPHPNS